MPLSTANVGTCSSERWVQVRFLVSAPHSLERGESVTKLPRTKVESPTFCDSVSGNWSGETLPARKH